MASSLSSAVRSQQVVADAVVQHGNIPSSTAQTLPGTDVHTVILFLTQMASGSNDVFIVQGALCGMCVMGCHIAVVHVFP